jgi:hypothetical protein
LVGGCTFIHPTLEICCHTPYPNTHTFQIPVIGKVISNEKMKRIDIKKEYEQRAKPKNLKKKHNQSKIPVGRHNVGEAWI